MLYYLYVVGGCNILQNVTYYFFLHAAMIMSHMSLYSILYCIPKKFCLENCTWFNCCTGLVHIQSLNAISNQLNTPCPHLCVGYMYVQPLTATSHILSCIWKNWLELKIDRKDSFWYLDRVTGTSLQNFSTLCIV